MKIKERIDQFFHEILTIQDSTDVEGTINAINSNINIKGYNIWILVCSALLASIGLDTNSAAVIIGAMLISPLMSPILGVGLGLGINDRDMLYSALRNLGLATGLSLFFATLYFFLTPLGEPTSEILSRTRPTVLDVLVALFGGIAGIVSNSRNEKTNAIPGVAIATALMPPLCSAGYGLASMDFAIFGGAFYLFFINAVFISLSTYLMVKYLRFPIKHYVDPKTERNVTRWLSFILLIVIAPSLWFLYTILNEVRIQRNINQICIEPIEAEDYEVLKWELVDKDTTKVIKVYLAGNELNDSIINVYNQKLVDEGMRNYRVNYSRVNVSKDEIKDLSEETASQIIRTFELKQNAENEKLQKEIASLKLQKELEVPEVKGISDELKALFQDINQVGIGRTVYLRLDSTGNPIYTNDSIPQLILDTITSTTVRWQPIIAKYKRQRLTLQEKREEKKQSVFKFLQIKFKNDSLEVIHI